MKINKQYIFTCAALISLTVTATFFEDTIFAKCIGSNCTESECFTEQLQEDASLSNEGLDQASKDFYNVADAIPTFTDYFNRNQASYNTNDINNELANGVANVIESTTNIGTFSFSQVVESLPIEKGLYEGVFNGDDISQTDEAKSIVEENFESVKKDDAKEDDKEKENKEDVKEDTKEKNEEEDDDEEDDEENEEDKKKTSSIVTPDTDTAADSSPAVNVNDDGELSTAFIDDKIEFLSEV